MAIREDRLNSDDWALDALWSAAQILRCHSSRSICNILESWRNFTRSEQKEDGSKFMNHSQNPYIRTNWSDLQTAVWQPHIHCTTTGSRSPQKRQSYITSWSGRLKHDSFLWNEWWFKFLFLFGKCSPLHMFHTKHKLWTSGSSCTHGVSGLF